MRTVLFEHAHGHAGQYRASNPPRETLLLKSAPKYLDHSQLNVAQTMIAGSVDG
jgi:hypothetical protein